MTDLELTKLCAEAMGIEVAEQLGGMRFLNTQYESSLYDPLASDAQAMALVKRFEMKVFWHEGRWNAQIPSIEGRRGAGAFRYPDLNRAICECVAKMQANSK